MVQYKYYHKECYVRHSRAAVAAQEAEDKLTGKKSVFLDPDSPFRYGYSYEKEE